jgi:hypothetical protein
MEGGATATDLKLVCVLHKGKPYYQIELTLNMQGASQPSILITTRNEPHRWADLNRAVAFVERVFSGVHDILLVVAR